MLRAEGITVRFRGLHALDKVSIEAASGTVTGLIGPNGAGKTTLFNVITGLQKPDSGRIHLDDADLTNVGAKRRARMGMARTFQRLETFGSLTVRDNVRVALEAYRGQGHGSRRGRDPDVLLDRVGILGHADVRADLLPTGTARLLEMARALATEPKLLLLDEVSSGLDADESAFVGRLLCDIAGEGVAVLLVEHDMDLVMRSCASLWVLDFGKLIAAGTPAEIQADPVVRAAYLGTETFDIAEAVEAAEGWEVGQ
jgi:branched-chain amino acid transport system ATP-binding protein